MLYIYILFKAQIEQLIIPSLLNLVKENNEDFHIDCVSVSIFRLFHDYFKYKCIFL